MVRRIVAFLVAIATLVFLGSIAHSLFVQHAWLNAAAQSGAPTGGISFAERLQWIGHDLIGLQPSYGLVTTIALFLGLLLAGLITRYTRRRLAIFALAGAICIFTMYTILKLVLGTVGIFGARGTAGMLAQMLAGLIAAVLFAVLTPARAPASLRPATK
jgi:hypothetical protein